MATMRLAAAAALGLAGGASAEPWPEHPTWTPTWDMAASTIMMPCNTSGWFDAELAAKYGIADFDWSNARAMWANHAPMDDGGRLITQAAKVQTPAATLREPPSPPPSAWSAGEGGEPEDARLDLQEPGQGPQLVLRRRREARRPGLQRRVIPLLPAPP